MKRGPGTQMRPAGDAPHHQQQAKRGSGKKIEARMLPLKKIARRDQSRNNDTHTIQKESVCVLLYITVLDTRATFSNMCSGLPLIWRTIYYVYI